MYMNGCACCQLRVEGAGVEDCKILKCQPRITLGEYSFVFKAASAKSEEYVHSCLSIFDTHYSVDNALKKSCELHNCSPL